MGAIEHNRRFETEKYVFNVWFDAAFERVIRASIRLTQHETQRRDEGTLTIEEVADQLKNLEKWRLLREAARLFFALIRE